MVEGLVRRMRALTTWRPSPAWGLATGVVLVTALLGLNRVSEFLYFQF